MEYGYYFHHLTEDKLKSVERLSHLSMDVKQLNINATIQKQPMRLRIHGDELRPATPDSSRPTTTTSFRATRVNH